MIVLGIESTCDETAAAVVVDGQKILSEAIASSASIHEKYGGVFPELASRCHIEAILPVIEEALQKAQIKAEQIDLIAVAKGPGLIGSLLIGLNAAKGLSIALKKPFIGVNHVEAHLYAAMMEAPQLFPALGFVLSGGHTFMVQIEKIGHYKLLGTTVDDAIGEAFDKTAALLGLPYPGGPHIETLALSGNPKACRFSGGKVKRNPLDFSFSGLKTGVLYAVKGQEFQKADIAASFQETAVADIVEKGKRALERFSPRAIYLGGGVCLNQRLRDAFATSFPDLPVYWPPISLCMDNAAMIGGLGYQIFKEKGVGDPLDLEAETRIRFSLEPIRKL